REAAVAASAGDSVRSGGTEGLPGPLVRRIAASTARSAVEAVAADAGHAADGVTGSAVDRVAACSATAGRAAAGERVATRSAVAAGRGVRRGAAVDRGSAAGATIPAARVAGAAGSTCSADGIIGIGRVIDFHT